MSMEKYLAERKEKVDEGDATKQIVANMVNNVTFNLIKEFVRFAFFKSCKPTKTGASIMFWITVLLLKLFLEGYIY